MSHPYPPHPAPRRSGPHLAWLWLGVAIAVLSIGSVVAYAAVHFDELEAADSPAQSGPGVVTIGVSEGQSYGVYMPAGDAPEFAASLSCRISAGDGASAPLVLDEWGGGLDGPVRSEFGQRWEAVGEFDSPVDGFGTVACEDAAAGLLVRPDDDAFLGFGLALIVGVLLGLAGATLAVAVGFTRVRRRRTRWGGPGDSFYAPGTADQPPAPYHPPPGYERGPGFPGPGAGV